MRLHKAVNRVYHGKVYYRWLVSVPPKNLRELGWADGQELEASVSGSSLWIRPALRAHPVKPERCPTSLREEVQRKTISHR
jgi:antitoxin component of MazEF toxin-antitoxin module